MSRCPTLPVCLSTTPLSAPTASAFAATARRLGLDLPLRDIDESFAHREELVEATGRQSVPCLRIEREDGSVEWMHESEDIAAYLEARFGARNDAALTAR